MLAFSASTDISTEMNTLKSKGKFVLPTHQYRELLNLFVLFWGECIPNLLTQSSIVLLAGRPEQEPQNSTT